MVALSGPPRDVAPRQPSFDDLGTPLFDVTFVVLDLETTGLSAGSDRVTEIGAVKVRGGDILGEFQSLVHPGRPIPPAITAVTGINDAMIAGSPSIGALLATLQEFLRDTVLVAHNARFDKSFLDAEFERHSRPALSCTVLDTARLARRLVRDEVRDVRLATLAMHFRSATRPEHRALPDARATVDVLHGLIERAGSLGAMTLEDLIDLSRSTSDKAFRKVGLVADAPRCPGIYRFLDGRGEVLYVGKATDLRSRLRQYFGQDPRRRIADMVRETATVDWTVTAMELEAAVYEIRQIQAHRPRYNRRSKHPERAVYVKLTAERFPRLSVVTTAKEDRGHYLGPLASRRAAQQFVEAVYEVMPLRQCTMRIRAAQDHRSCVLKDLGRCGSPCDGTQDLAAYGAVADAYRQAVDGDPRALLEPLRARMEEFARDDRFERARGARTRLHTTAAVLHDARWLASLARPAEIVAARRSGSGWHVVRLRHGRLVSTTMVVSLESEAQLRLSLDAGADTIDGHDPARSLVDDRPLIQADQVEERRLVARWLATDGVRLLSVVGELSEPLHGGELLARTQREARRVDRRVRRDRQVLVGDKISVRV